MFKILIVHVYWKFEELLQVFGRHVASNRMVSGAYKTEYGDGDDISKVIKRVEVRGGFIMAWETYCVCSVSYYYYITPTVVGWWIAILRFFFTIIIILIILPHIFVCSISRRCLDQTLWNLVGISYAMWSCTFKCWFFQNGCCCHGNGQNSKKLKKHKNDHSRLLAKQKLMKLDRNNIHI